MKNRTKALQNLQEMSQPGAVKAAFAEELATSNLPAAMRTLARTCKEARTSLDAVAGLSADDREWLNEIKLAAEEMLQEIKQTLGDDMPMATDSARRKAQTMTLKMQARLRGLNH